MNAGVQMLYRPEDAAAALGLGRSKVFELMAQGRLRSVTVGRSRRIPAEALRAFVDELVEQANGAA